MSSPATVNIVCAKSKLPCVPAIRYRHLYGDEWRCSFCGARVKVVA